MNNLHTLTALTGRNANQHRSVIVQGFDMNRRNAVISAILALPTVLVTVVAWTLVAQFAVLVGAAAFGAGWWMIGTTSRHGLQRRTFEALLDKRRSDTGKFFLCGRVIDPDLHELGVLAMSTVPYGPATKTAVPPVVALPPVTGATTGGPAPTPQVSARSLAVAGFDPGDTFGGPR